MQIQVNQHIVHIYMINLNKMKPLVYEVMLIILQDNLVGK